MFYFDKTFLSLYLHFNFLSWKTKAKLVLCVFLGRTYWWVQGSIPKKMQKKMYFSAALSSLGAQGNWWFYAQGRSCWFQHFQDMCEHYARNGVCGENNCIKSNLCTCWNFNSECGCSYGATCSFSPNPNSIIYISLYFLITGNRIFHLHFGFNIAEIMHLIEISAEHYNTIKK